MYGQTPQYGLAVASYETIGAGPQTESQTGQPQPQASHFLQAPHFGVSVQMPMWHPGMMSAANSCLVGPTVHTAPHSGPSISLPYMYSNSGRVKMEPLRAVAPSPPVVLSAGVRYPNPDNSLAVQAAQQVSLTGLVAAPSVVQQAVHPRNIAVSTAVSTAAVPRPTVMYSPAVYHTPIAAPATSSSSVCSTVLHRATVRAARPNVDSKEVASTSEPSSSLVSRKSAFARKRSAPIQSPCADPTYDRTSVAHGPKRVKASTAQFVADAPTGSWSVPFVSCSVDTSPRSSESGTPSSYASSAPSGAPVAPPQSWVAAPAPAPLMTAQYVLIDPRRVAGNGMQPAVKREVPATFPPQTPSEEVQDLSKYEDVNSSFKCRDCGKGFKHRYNLAKHEELAHKGDVFAGKQCCRCKYCDKRFLRKGDLKKHHRTHTGEKPYVCPLCGRAFNDPSNMRRHLRNTNVHAPQ